MLFDVEYDWNEFALRTSALSTHSRFITAVTARDDFDMITDTKTAEQIMLAALR